eukprot:6208575-Pleurochrysis_carterae.AAC.3
MRERRGEESRREREGGRGREGERQTGRRSGIEREREMDRGVGETERGAKIGRSRRRGEE